MRFTALLAMKTVALALLITVLAFGEPLLLGDVQTIYVGSMGQGDEAERFRMLLDEQLSDTGFTPVDDPDAADAIMTGVLTVRVHAETSQARATIALKSDGQRIWSGDFQPRRTWKPVKDTVRFRAQNIAKDLQKAKKKAKKKAQRR